MLSKTVSNFRRHFRKIWGLNNFQSHASGFTSRFVGRSVGVILLLFLENFGKFIDLSMILNLTQPQFSDLTDIN